MKILIIGLGSIAQKHIKVIKELKPNADIFALRSNHNVSKSNEIQNIFSWSEIPIDLDFILISNPTSLHAETIVRCLDYNVPLFIEKPVLNSLDKSSELISEVKKRDLITYVACNLRFHPAIQFLKKEISKNLPIEYNSYCGSYLPEWRPNSDYREIYSAKKELGGGVHLDLIHEVDFCTYLLGSPINRINYFRRKSDLEINSVDVAHFVFEYENTSAFITLNYYRRTPKREIECIWKDKTWTVDLLKNSIVDGKGENIYSEPFKIMDTYTNQMKTFMECLEIHKMPENNLEEGINTLKLIINE